MTGERYLGEPDPTAVARDDALLDHIASAAPEPGDDPAVALLTAWRARAVEAVPPPGSLLDGAKPAVDPAVVGRRRMSAPPRVRRRVAVGILSGAVVLMVGAGVVASDANPESPLWTVSRWLDAERADARQAEDAIAQARLAAADGRYADARAQLDRAAPLIQRLGATERARELQRQSDDVLRLLPPVTPPAIGGTPSGTPAEGVPGPADVPSARPDPDMQATPPADADTGAPQDDAAKPDGDPGQSGVSRPSVHPTPRPMPARSHHS